jgi:hypothetical protein
MVAASRGVALAGGLVGAPALEGVRDDARVCAERVHRGQPDGVAEFSGHSGGQSESDAGDVRVRRVRGGGEQDGVINFRIMLGLIPGKHCYGEYAHRKR